MQFMEKVARPALAQVPDSSRFSEPSWRLNALGKCLLALLAVIGAFAVTSHAYRQATPPAGGWYNVPKGGVKDVPFNTTETVACSLDTSLSTNIEVRAFDSSGQQTGMITIPADGTSENIGVSAGGKLELYNRDGGQAGKVHLSW